MRSAKSLITIRFLMVYLFVAVQVVPAVAWACPTCKDGLHEDGTAFGYAFSILFMMGMPFAIMTAWAIAIYRLRSKAAQLAISNQ